VASTAQQSPILQELEALDPELVPILPQTNSASISRHWSRLRAAPAPPVRSCPSISDGPQADLANPRFAPVTPMSAF
jgi:hypothetical protein